MELENIKNGQVIAVILEVLGCQAGRAACSISYVNAAISTSPQSSSKPAQNMLT
jgi:hypothetical protein